MGQIQLVGALKDQYCDKHKGGNDDDGELSNSYRVQAWFSMIIIHISRVKNYKKYLRVKSFAPWSAQ